MKIQTVSLRAANDFVNSHHRHHTATVGHKFSIGAFQNGTMIGVAICGRPISRHLDDGVTLEVLRLCVLDGYKNTCSFLYGACARAAKALGYARIITYICDSEPGTSLIASGWALDKLSAGGGDWSCPSRPRGLPLFEDMPPKYPTGLKKRFIKILDVDIQAMLDAALEVGR